MSITIGDIESKYNSIISEFKDAFNPINGLVLLSGSYLLLKEEKLPEYLKAAIKRDHLKDIREIKVENLSFALEVTFTYEDGTNELFESSTIAFKQDKDNACRVIEWMLNLKYINDNE